MAISAVKTKQKCTTCSPLPPLSPRWFRGSFGLGCRTFRMNITLELMFTLQPVTQQGRVFCSRK